MTDPQFHDLIELIKYISGGSGVLIGLWIFFKYG